MTDKKQSTGISNRSREREQREQEQVPPRGTAQGETDPLLKPRPGEHPPPRDPAPKQKNPKHPAPE